MTIREYSAGVVPFFRTSKGRKYLLLKSGLTLNELWEFPKGMIEKGETSQIAALREFREETGIPECKLVPGFKKVLKYFYRRGGKDLVAKSVSYYLGETETQEVTLSHESTGFVWVSPEEAKMHIRHKNLLELLAQAEEFLVHAGL